MVYYTRHSTQDYTKLIKMSMKFCEYCANIMSAITHQGDLKFHCGQCAENVEADPDDTLMAEFNYRSNDSADKSEVMLQQAAFDRARKLVDKPCPSCKLPFLTHVYVSSHMISKYICSCGYNVLSKNYKNPGKAK